MGGEISDEEGDVLRGSETVDKGGGGVGRVVVVAQRLTQREARRLDFLPKLGIGKRAVTTDDGNLGGIALGILFKIID